MSDKLTDEAYARAALTYLAEPADRWLGQLLRVHGAAATLDAIKTYCRFPRRRPRPAERQGTRGDESRHGAMADPAARAAGAGGGARLPRVGHQAHRCPGDPEWPGQLADLGDDQPYALWLRGNADLRFSCLRSVAVVGSRAATAYGSYVAAEFAASVAARGLAVVSGGAFGVDAAAHRGALGADGVTVAVLACGVDVPYPTAHAELFDAIAAQGVLVSEWPPGQHVSRLRFLVRNRVIAALATGTLVVEAGQRSGALNTARHARDLRRRLMAVPGPVTSDLSAGCHQVIREWQGMLVTSAAEVIEHLSPVGATASATASGSGRAPCSLAAARRRPVIPRDLLDLESARVLDAMPRPRRHWHGAGGAAGGPRPAATATCLGKLATGGFVERCDDGWRLRRS